MKITGNIEVSGIDRVVFYKTHLFQRVMVPGGSFLWIDMLRNKKIPDRNMIGIIKAMVGNPKRKVWVHGPTINIDRIEKRAKKKPVVIGVSPEGLLVRW